MAAFARILVPLDFTPKNNAALEVAQNLSEPGETDITLLHVVEAIPHAEDDPLIAFYRSLESNAQHKLDSIAKPLRASGHSVKTRILLGKPARCIVGEAEPSDFDLIVLSSHPLGAGDGANNWATVSYQVSVFCRCPVLLVK